MRCAISEKPDAEEEFSSVWAGVSSDEAGMRSAKLNCPSLFLLTFTSSPSSPTVLISMRFLKRGFKAILTTALSALTKVPLSNVVGSDTAKSSSVTPMRFSDTSLNVTSRLSVCWAYCCAMAFSFSGGNMMRSVITAAISSMTAKTANTRMIFSSFFIVKL